jgi:CxxC motif-containing protein
VPSITCIICPIGCSLAVDKNANGELSISGNKCPRGSAYAQEEIQSPKRIVTASCKVNQSKEEKNLHHKTHRRISVKSNSPCPKNMIDDLLKDIYTTSVTLPVKAGDVILSNWKETGIDVSVTRSMKQRASE